MNQPSLAPRLEIQNLHAGYKTRGGFLNLFHQNLPVVENIDLTIPSGETLGLVGESGSGKTTLGRAILGLASVFSGSILYRRTNGDTINLAGLARREFRPLRKELQIIFQDPYSSLNPRMRVLDLLLEGLRVHYGQESREQHMVRCKKTLDLVGLSESALERYPHEFSGGQRQRIGIARSLVLEPDLIVCDESVSALDVSMQAQILNLLIDLQNEMKLTYLFISHDISVVRHISHRIAVMKDGKIVEKDDADRIVHHAGNEYTKKLVSAIPALEVRH